MNRMWGAGSIVLVLVLAGSAGAVGVGVRAGTSGVGADVAFGVAPMVSARLGYSAFNTTHQMSDSDFKYDAKLQLKNASLLLDFSPPAMPLRLTAGLVASGNKVDVTATPNGGGYSLNGTQYSTAQIGHIDGQIKGARSTVPYLGIGWGNVSGTGVNVYGDLGVMLMGGGKARLDAQCTAVGAAVCASADFQRNLAAERSKLEDDVKGFNYYPVINIGVTAGF